LPGGGGMDEFARNSSFSLGIDWPGMVASSGTDFAIFLIETALSIPNTVKNKKTYKKR
jgi:hypothetical protein